MSDTDRLTLAALTELAQHVQGGKKRRKAGVGPACLPASRALSGGCSGYAYLDLAPRVVFVCLASLSSAALLALVSSERF